MYLLSCLVLGNRSVVFSNVPACENPMFYLEQSLVVSFEFLHECILLSFDFLYC